MGYRTYIYILKLTNRPTLQNCRLYLKMCTLYKTVQYLIYFPSNVVLPKHNSVVPTPLLHQPFARDQCILFIFCPVSCILMARSSAWGTSNKIVGGVGLFPLAGHDRILAL